MMKPPPSPFRMFFRRQLRRVLPKERQRVWGMVLGILTVGTIVKVVYFKYSRKIMVRDAHRQQEQGHQHWQEAQQFAAWSTQDRRERLPSLTPEQKTQMRDYLLLLEQHGWHKAAQECHTAAEGGEDRRQCPVLSQTSFQKKKMVTNESAIQ